MKFLLRVFQRKTRVPLYPTTIATLQLKLVPYFSCTHPTRGLLAGPYGKLPAPSLRRLALDLVATSAAASGLQGAATTLYDAVNDAVCNTEEEMYWVQIRTWGSVS